MVLRSEPQMTKEPIIISIARDKSIKIRWKIFFTEELMRSVIH